VASRSLARERVLPECGFAGGSIREEHRMVYIVLVNWNGWRDTIECLESLLRLTGADFTVVVCDNASVDGSLDKIRAWARGEIAAESGNPSLRSFIEPPASKPVAVFDATPGSNSSPPAGARLVLIQTGANIGYAGANNVGMHFALAQPQCSHIWLLNNDTIVDPRALAALLARTREAPRAGMCGSTVLYYHHPEIVAGLGGASYSPWTARHRLLYAGRPASSLPDPRAVEARMDFVSGAALLVSRALVERAGFLSEDYFLYAEEPDWALRARPHFALAYAPTSVVFHKEGASIQRMAGHSTASSGTASHGSSTQVSGHDSGDGPGLGNPQSVPTRVRGDFWLTRSRIVFTRKHCWYFLPSVCAVVAASFFLRLVRGRFRNCGAVWAGFCSGFALHPSVESARRLADRVAS
jgi:GT2 family glycosyltransferase